MNSEFYSENEICRHIKSFEQELIDRSWQIMSKCGNRYTDDVLQETYLKCCTLFLDAKLLMYEFKKHVLEVCEEVCWEFMNEERVNPTKPRGFSAIKHNEQGGADFQWEVIEDNRGNAENRMIAIDDIKSIRDYKGKWLPYRYAIQYVHLLQLRDKTDWENYCNSKRKLPNIPDNPDTIYAEFGGWDKFLGIRYFDYNDCCNWVRNNVFVKSELEWNDILTSLPKQVPLFPAEYYANDGWTNWEYFLGINSEIGTRYLSYEDAQKWVEDNLWEHSLSENKWELYINGKLKDSPLLPSNIPINPESIYKATGWVSWFRWFGNHRRLAKTYKRTYSECSKWMKINAPMVKNKDDWERFLQNGFYVRKPDWIPDKPDFVFRNGGWHGWWSFLNESKSISNDTFGSISCNNIRILYNGEKIWVQPLGIENNLITGKVVTAICNIGQNSIIKFNSKYIIATSAIGEKKVQQKIKSDYEYNRLVKR